MAIVRFEVWTRPDTGSFTRKFPLQNIVDWDFELGIFGRGTIVLPKGYSRIDDVIFVDPSNHANDESSIIRAYIGETHLYDFYASRASIMVGDKGARTVTITGGGPGSSLDRTKVRQLDYPLNPPEEPDWAYGADNTILENNDFEDGTNNVFENGDFEEDLVSPWEPITGSDTNELDVDLVISSVEYQSGLLSLEIDPGKRHSGATQTLPCTPSQELTLNGYLKCATVGKRFTAVVKVEDGMTFDSSNNGYIYNGWYIVEIDNILRNGKTGLPGGQSSGTWQRLGQIKVTPGPSTESLQYGVQYDHHDATNGPVFFIDSFTGTGLGVGLDPWKSHFLTTMEIETVEVYSGTQAAKVGGGADAAFYQEIDGLTIGRRYTATFIVKQKSGVSKDIGVQYLVSGSSGSTVLTTETVLDDTWTKIHASWVATSETARVETKNKSGGVLDWYVGLASVAMGYPLSTYGKIMNDLLDDSAISHAPNRTALAWMTRTWTDTLDSNGNAWDQEVAITISRGQPYRRIVSFMADGFGYEARVRPDPADHTDLWFDLYNPEGMGIDHSVTDGKAVMNSGFVSLGPIIRREPFATYAMVEGELMKWWEDRNTVTEAAWGEIEAYEGTDEISSVSLAPVAARMVSAEEGETIVVSFQGPNLIAGIDYDIGDIVMLIFGEDILPAAAYRVAAINFKSGDPEPTVQVQFVSEGL